MTSEKSTEKPNPNQLSKEAEPTIDFIKALDNLTNIENHVLQFKGKEDMNPYFFIRDKINPLRESYYKGNRSRELYNSMMKLTISMMKLTKMEPVAPKD